MREFLAVDLIFFKHRLDLRRLVSIRQLLHNLFPEQLNLLELRQILLLPYLHRHTNEQKLVLHTSDQIYDPRRAHASAIAVVLEIIQTARGTFATSPPAKMQSSITD